jgi:hypothetical protein
VGAADGLGGGVPAGRGGPVAGRGGPGLPLSDPGLPGHRRRRPVAADGGVVHE